MLTYRPLTLTDLPAVLAAEHDAQPAPWSENLMRAALDEAHGYFSWVAEEDCAFAGFGVMQRVQDESHLHNFAILRARQRRGLGRQMLAWLLDRARTAGAVRMLLEVRAGNAAARALYDAAGFRPIGLRRNYYAAPASDDAIVMERRLLIAP